MLLWLAAPDTRHDCYSRAPEGGRSVPQRNETRYSCEWHGVASKQRQETARGGEVPRDSCTEIMLETLRPR